jgi:hypothetical protein
MLAAGALLMLSLAGVSAHFVRGLAGSGLAAAFVSSPTSASDPLISLAWSSGTTTVDTGLKVACFHVANSSAPREGNLDWPRITGVGFELPGSLSGFTLLAPHGEWQIAENVPALLDDQKVTLDFAIVARVNPTGRTPGQPHDPLGIEPGQAESRRSGTRFCVSGPFPPGLTIEGMLNGVVVEFHGLDNGPRGEAGVWYPTPAGATGPGPVPRAIPLY